MYNSATISGNIINPCVAAAKGATAFLPAPFDASLLIPQLRSLPFRVVMPTHFGSLLLFHAVARAPYSSSLLLFDLHFTFMHSITSFDNCFVLMHSNFVTTLTAF